MKYLTRGIVKILALLYAGLYMRRPSAYELILEKYSSLSSALITGINLLLYYLRSTYSFRVTTISIEPTNICNLHCTICAHNGGIRRKKGFMSLGLVKKLVRENPSVETFAIAAFGEPTLHRELPAIIRAIKAGGKRVDIHTNGYQLSNKLLLELFSSGADTLNFSLDALDNDFEAIRGFPYSHIEECIVRAVGLKMNNGFSTQIKIQGVVSATTFRYSSAISQRWKGIVDSVKFVPYRFLGTDNGKKGGCMEAWRGAVVVLWDGRVMPCCYDCNGTLSIGNAAQQSLREIWNSVPARRLRSSLLDGNRSTLCQQCAEWWPQ